MHMFSSDHNPLKYSPSGFCFHNFQAVRGSESRVIWNILKELHVSLHLKDHYYLHQDILEVGTEWF